MLNWAIRYAAVTNLLTQDMSPILDVGSGAHGLSRYWSSGFIVQTDLHFEDHPAGVAPMVASTAEKLPFADASFSAVISLDLLEHLEPPTRAAAVAEIVRVSRGLVIMGFPTYGTGERTDRFLAALLRRLGRNLPPWLREHLQLPYPSVGEVARELPGSHQVVQVVPNDPWPLHLAVVALEFFAFGRKFLERLDRPGLARQVAGLRFARPYRKILVIERVGAADGVRDAAA